MRIEITRESLLEPLLAVNGVVEKRQTLPVLSNVLLQISEQSIIFTGTDLEIQLTASTSDFKLLSDESGEITLPARKLTDICKNFSEGSLITISIERERAVIRSGKSRFTLTTLPAQDFPLMESIKSVTELTVTKKALKSLLEKTQFCMANQDVRYYLNGLLIETKDNLLTAVATDGHRLAKTSVTLDYTNQEQQIIIPRKGIQELFRLLDDSDETCKLNFNNNFAQISLNNVSFFAKLIDGRFPDYNRVIPQESETIMSVNREVLKQSLVRTSVLSNEKYRGIRLNLTKDKLSLSINNPEQEEAEEELDVSFNVDEPLEIGFNVSYLIDALNAIHSEDVDIHLLDQNSSCLIMSKDDSETKYVVMPMRL